MDAGDTTPAGAGAAGGKPPKRQMKSPYQLEVLEKTYAETEKPSEVLRAELSAKLGLTDRQLQMWFCHRRHKDRKRQASEDDEPPSLQMPAHQVAGREVAVERSEREFKQRKVARREGVERVAGDVVVNGNRYYEAVTFAAPPVPRLLVMEMRAIASVEAQLGEPLRDPGPILGFEFDPLPPGAFGAPIALTEQQHQPVRSFDAKMYERHEAQPAKASSLLPSVDHSFIASSSGKKKPAGGGSLVVHSRSASRALHEYKILSEQPRIYSEEYERPALSHIYDPSVVPSSARTPILASGEEFLHGNKQVAPSHTFQGQMLRAGHVPHRDRHVFPSDSAEYDSAMHSNSFINNINAVKYDIRQVIGSENPSLAHDGRIPSEDPIRIERKRKSGEPPTSMEVEAHEKRLKRELEKQDFLRKKREEQMRKEMERHDRERKKEEERLLKERQREEERYQKEQRRELERREKFLQKESLRAQKRREKEELRREKEIARLKAANERATARRLAKESMELIEDERLELMECAASTKGLSSILSLDSDTLQQLDSFREMLCLFPPKEVQLKRPFSIQPWTNSEENIGKLLMVWKFLINFADVLGLWPFTLDEFVQSLHDYESRLLGEIHIALLKSIIKDIEDAARSAAVPSGINQNSAANPGGGHPQIVEGAYAWGFDIHSWKLHLNPLTWPEILRQFALSAGFGPQLKKRVAECMSYRKDNEVNDGEDVLSTLRNGAAAENAVAMMQGKGYSHRRRSRHCLTPGTVKFAAFHVLSLEGSRGLPTVEIADRIQKSGLRDLTTCKRPEASIAVALSRDAQLFERTAPSTFCVRAPYRKDPSDADAVLSAAREKIQIMESGHSGSEEAGKDVQDADDADEDSECDVAEDPESDGPGNETKMTSILQSNELKGVATSCFLDNRKEVAVGDKFHLGSQNGFINVEKSFSTPLSGNSKEMSASVSFESLDMNTSFQEAGVENAQIDESNFGEPWVQGLTEGEYSDLSVEERLVALVSLVEVATEGNSIRGILEERLEAATALKKQMWAEVQLDKRRLKDDYEGKVQHSSVIGCKVEATPLNAAVEGSRTPEQTGNSNGNDANLDLVNSKLNSDRQNNNDNHLCTERNISGQDFSSNPDTIPLQPEGYTAEKARSNLKSFIGHKAEELYAYRSLPLGQDRRRNRYWLFATSASRNDPGSGRIFFESREGFWRLIDTEEAFDSLVAVLDTRGLRESHLHSMLKRIETSFKETIRRQKISSSVDSERVLVKTGATEMSSSPDCSTDFDSNIALCGLTPDTLQCSSSFKIELGRSEVERTASLKRYNCFMRWMWKECYNPFILCAQKYGKTRCSELLQICHLCYQTYFPVEKHCSSCHKTFKSFQNTYISFSDHVSQCEGKRNTDPYWKIQVSDSTVSIGILLLKAQLSLIEASIPAEALQFSWSEGQRESWGVKLQSSSSAKDLLQVLTLLEGAINHDSLSSNFETTNELLMSASGSTAGTAAATFGSVPVLPWVPDTTAAVALRLLDLDASICYMKVGAYKDKDAEELIKLPSKHVAVKSIQAPQPVEFPEQVDCQYERKWLDPGIGLRGRGRGGRGVGRGRGHGGRGVRRIGISTRTEFREVGAVIYETGKRTRGRTRGRGRGRGRRSVRPHQRSESQAPEQSVHFGNFNDTDIGVKQHSAESSSRSSAGEDWHSAEMRMPYIEDDNSAESQSDVNGHESGEEYDDQPPCYGDTGIRVYGSKSMKLLDEESDDDDDDDDDDADEDGVEDGRDFEANEYLHADMDDDCEEEMQDGIDVGDAEVNEDEDGALSSFSSEYSD